MLQEENVLHSHTSISLMTGLVMLATALAEAQLQMRVD